MLKLKDVDYTDFQNLCIKYSIDRCGFDLSIDDFKKIADANKIPISDDKSFKVGDILLRGSTNRNYASSCPTIKNDRILEKSINTQYHCCVYEGKGIFSDAIISDNFFVTFRNRMLDDMPTVEKMFRIPYAAFTKVDK